MALGFFLFGFKNWRYLLQQAQSSITRKKWVEKGNNCVCTIYTIETVMITTSYWNAHCTVKREKKCWSRFHLEINKRIELIYLIFWKSLTEKSNYLFQLHKRICKWFVIFCFWNTQINIHYIFAVTIITMIVNSNLLFWDYRFSLDFYHHHHHHTSHILDYKKTNKNNNKPVLLPPSHTKKIELIHTLRTWNDSFSSFKLRYYQKWNSFNENHVRMLWTLYLSTFSLIVIKIQTTTLMTSKQSITFYSI